MATEGFNVIAQSAYAGYMHCFALPLPSSINRQSQAEQFLLDFDRLLYGCDGHHASRAWVDPGVATALRLSLLLAFPKETAGLDEDANLKSYRGCEILPVDRITAQMLHPAPS
jgi:hypothetical protein